MTTTMILTMSNAGDNDSVDNNERGTASKVNHQPTTNERPTTNDKRQTTNDRQTNRQLRGLVSICDSDAIYGEYPRTVYCGQYQMFI